MKKVPVISNEGNLYKVQIERDRWGNHLKVRLWRKQKKWGITRYWGESVITTERDYDSILLSGDLVRTVEKAIEFHEDKLFEGEEEELQRQSNIDNFKSWNGVCRGRK